jgi:hypothetical protein
MPFGLYARVCQNIGIASCIDFTTIKLPPLDDHLFTPIVYLSLYLFYGPFLVLFLVSIRFIRRNPKHWNPSLRSMFLKGNIRRTYRSNSPFEVENDTMDLTLFASIPMVVE